MVSEVKNLEQMLAKVEGVARGQDAVSLRLVLASFGRRSFAPLLLLAGLITVAPILGDIPGIPTVMGVFVVLTCAQMLIHRQHLWLPAWLLDRAISGGKLLKVLGWAQRPARFVDRLLRPRLAFMLHKVGTYAIACTCMLIGVLLPTMELIPLTANGAGAALTAFGLALIADDGLVALLAFVVTALTLGLAVYALM